MAAEAPFLFPRADTVLFECLPVEGVSGAVCAEGTRYQGRADMALMRFEEGSKLSVLTTSNKFAAAPVQIVRKHLQHHTQQAQASIETGGGIASPLFAIINAGNANAGTGQQGYRIAQDCCYAVAEEAATLPDSVFPFSTGVIGEIPNGESMTAAIPELVAQCRPDFWEDAATAIHTTDTTVKAGTVALKLEGAPITISGIAKGAAMIAPNMATTLIFAATDATLSAQDLQLANRLACEESFNRISIDGDQSTNDCLLLAATGRAKGEQIKSGTAQFDEFCAALEVLYYHLAACIMEDAEGCHRVFRVDVRAGYSKRDCGRLAQAVVRSTLLKTALAAGDANWGRILMALGSAAAEMSLDFVPEMVSIAVGDTVIASAGAPDPAYREEIGAQAFSQPYVPISIDVASGEQARHQSFALGVDLTTEYVRMNSTYRT